MRKFIVAAVAAALLIIGVGITYASIPASDGTINGCYKTAAPHQGELIVRDSATTCPSGYTELNWPSKIGWQVVTGGPVTFQAGQQANVQAICPPGWWPVGGGYTWSGEVDAMDITVSRPLNNDRWNVAGPVFKIVDLTAYVVCLNGVTSTGS